MVGMGVYSMLVVKVFNCIGFFKIVIVGIFISMVVFLVMLYGISIYFIMISYGIVFGFGFCFVFLFLYLVMFRYFIKRCLLVLGFVVIGFGGGLFVMSFVV